MEKKEDKLEEYQRTVFYYPTVKTNNIETTKETDHIIKKQKSWERENSSKTYCDYICEAIPLIFKNFKLKICDNLLLGGEHVQKISPGYNSPIKNNFEINSAKFFSLENLPADFDDIFMPVLDDIKLCDTAPKSGHRNRYYSGDET